MKKQPERPGTCPRSFIRLVDIHKTPLLLYWAPTGRIPLISITTATPFYLKEAEAHRGPGTFPQVARKWQSWYGAQV